MGRRLYTAALIAAVVLLVSSCGDDDTPRVDGVPPPPPARKLDPPAMGRAPDILLTDQFGASFHSDDLWGKVWIVNFMFTRCRGTCPLQAVQLSDIQEKLVEQGRVGDVHLLSLTVDAEHDTPAVLKDYAETQDANPQVWSFLTGDKGHIWGLSTNGFLLPTGDDPSNTEMPISHSARFVLVDRFGRIRGYYDSLEDEGIERLWAAIEKVVAEEPLERVGVAPTIFAPPWLEARAAAQVKASSRYGVRHDFRFMDRRLNSGIRFKHRATDASGKRYEVVHYDHGNGVSVADVDGDGLLDIYFSTQLGSNQLWRNAGDGTFRNITEDAGVAVTDSVGVTGSFADVDNDGDPDLYVTTVRGGNFLFENDGKGRFRDITKAAGLAYSGHSSSAVFFDYDRDGLLDLFLCNVGTYTTDEVVYAIDDATTDGLERGPWKLYAPVKDGFSGHIKPERHEESILYRNLGGNRFESMNDKLGLHDISWCGAASPVDGNEDGWPDLYVLNMQGNDEYYENAAGKAFVKKSRALFPKTPWGSMGIKVFDFDGDGRLDIYLTDMHSDMSEAIGPEREKLKARMQWTESMLRTRGASIFGNALFRKRGPNGYEEISDRVGAENYWPWGLSTGDLNADGFDDAFLASSMNFPFRYGVNSLLLNDHGRGFLDSEFVLGVEPRRGRLAKPWFEVDCAALGDRTLPICEKGVMGKAVVFGALGSRGSVIVDFDEDGDLDIITNDFNSAPLVLTSDLAAKEGLHFLKVRLQGSQSNRDGLGAVVRVQTGGRWQVKARDGQSGYLAQSVMPLYFGLGAAARAEAVEVTWPSGTKQMVREGIPANGTLEIVEPTP